MNKNETWEEKTIRLKKIVDNSLRNIRQKAEKNQLSIQTYQNSKKKTAKQ